MRNLLAQGSLQIAPNGGFSGFGKLGLQGNPGSSDLIFTNFISSVIGVMTIVAIIWFVFTFIAGAIGYLSSSGDKGAIESARKKIINGLIGLVLVIISTFVVNLIGYLIGVPNILNIPVLLNNITGVAVW